MDGKINVFFLPSMFSFGKLIVYIFIVCIFLALLLVLSAGLICCVKGAKDLAQQAKSCTKAVYDPDWQLPPIDLVEKQILLGCSSAKIRCPSA